MTAKDRLNSDLPVILFDDQAAWETWLARHLDSSAGLWIKIAKKSAPQPSVSYPEALEIALCYGWIDGQKRSFDGDYWLQKFTPRGPKSIWSKINREKALKLIEQDRMQPAGLEAIERAKQNGAWEAAYDSWKTTALPADLQTALEQHPQARAFFDTLDSRNRYAILFRTQTAKKAETRAKRIERFIEMLEKGEKLHP